MVIIFKGTVDAIELNAIPKEKIKDYVKQIGAPTWVSNLTKSGGLMAIMAPLGLGLVIALLFLLIKCFKKYMAKSEKFKNAVK